jgi:hypothetical protein
MAQVQGPATTLFDLGYTDLVSVERGGKRPAVLAGAGKWVGYSWNEEIPPGFQEEMDRCGANVGLRAGFFPGIDIDTDDPAATALAYDLAVELLGPAPIRRSSGARRLLVYRTDLPFKKRVVSFGDQAVEILGDGQQYVVYGTHPSGERYHFDKGHTLPKNPELLTRVTEEEIVEYLAQLAVLLEDEGYAVMVSGVGPTGAAAPLADEITAGSRNDTLASMAGSMRRRNFPKDAALAALVSANGLICTPPLDFEEVSAILDSIYENYEAVEELAVIPAAEEFEVEAVPDEPKKRRAFKMTEGTELMRTEFPEEEWLIDGLVPAHGTSLLVAKPKVGKSTLARGLAVAVAEGREVLGKEVLGGPVLYVMFPNEGTEREMVTELTRLGLVTEGQLHVLHDKDWTALKPEVLEFIREAAERVKPVLIVIDTLQGLVQASDLNDYAKVHKALEPIRSLVEHGGHLMYVHHAGKSERVDMMDCSLGSQALAGSVEVVMVMARDTEEQKLRYIAARGRGVEMDPHVLGIDEVSHEPSLGPSTEKFKAESLALKAVAALNEVGEPLHLDDLRSYLEVKRAPLLRVLKQLVDDNAITTVGKGVRGDPKLYTTTTATEEFEVEHE